MSVHTNPQPTSNLEQPPRSDADPEVVSRVRSRLGAPWRTAVQHRRLAWGLALLAAAGLGLVAGWWTPRGPLSAFEGLSAIGLGLLVGYAVGFLLHTRWAMLVAPVTFALCFELARLGASGPTVDGIHWGSTYGIMAFVVGRGVHGLLALLPMLLGAALGAGAGAAPAVDAASPAGIPEWAWSVVAPRCRCDHRTGARGPGCLRRPPGDH